ncbi:hypothetical protein DACRYDRAFT_107186 [Dacryopinax primogenitus]|uniref:Uncharacterized protein n=1 Tax=Dacryopinax primogenitus (strain DJM 731) TaxID=1858805 RepID=M5G212_DACPD|nr:uncharacterized protein DACRYDRAFT_107186 [Dacryopinax primogenitus]EJU02255.1 hypothetical protein DACRYDRAFT_107186 [Dacryopinax primogenitus]
MMLMVSHTAHAKSNPPLVLSPTHIISSLSTSSCTSTSSPSANEAAQNTLPPMAKTAILPPTHTQMSTNNPVRAIPNTLRNDARGIGVRKAESMKVKCICTPRGEATIFLHLCSTFQHAFPDPDPTLSPAHLLLTVTSKR